MKWFVLVVLVVLPLSAKADATDVHRLVVERLGHMEAVAVWKWNTGAAVEDLEREVIVLHHAVAEAVNLGLPEAAISRFFSAQIAAAKAIQFCWIDRFRIGEATPVANPPDLVKVVRPQLIELGNQITSAISSNTNDPSLGDTDSLSLVAKDLDCLDTWHLTELAEGLAQINQ